MQFRAKAKIMDREAMERALMRIAHEIVGRTKALKTWQLSASGIGGPILLRKWPLTLRKLKRPESLWESWI